MDNQRALQSLVHNSSLHVCINLVSQVLARIGYGDIEVLDRRLARQKSRLGGCELLCRSTFGEQQIRVIVKIIPDSMRTRMFDEMAGAIDRTKSDFGIIVPTKPLSDRFREASLAYHKSRVTVMDVDLLCQHLARFKIGVRPSGDPDYAFFSALEENLELVNEFFTHARIAR